MEMMIAKKAKQEEDDVDRISSLSDDILSHILSLLESREAVKTCLLSKRWEKVWTWIHSIRLYNESYVLQSYSDQERLDNRRKSLVKFVAWFLISGGKSPTSVTSFCLRCSTISGVSVWYYFPKRDIIREEIRKLDEEASYLIQWIDAAIRNPRLQNFDFDFGSVECFFSRTPLNMPPLLFKCQNLVVLNLNSVSVIDSIESNKIYLDVPKIVSLPSLEKLHLAMVVFKDENSLKNLLSGCPVLEQLFIRYVYNDKLFVCSRSLKKLTIDNRTDFDGRGISYVVEAPKLEYLCFQEHHHLTDFTMTANSPTLVSADIKISECSQHHPLELEFFQRINNVQNLELSLGKPIMFETNLPKFHNLIRLVLSRFGGKNDIVTRFLQLAPHLKHLIINKFLFSHGQFLWSPPDTVPKCLTSQLETIEIVGGYWRSKEQVLKMIEYLLDKGKVLKKLVITSYESYPSKTYDIQQILLFSKASQDCQIVEKDAISC